MSETDPAKDSVDYASRLQALIARNPTSATFSRPGTRPAQAVARETGQNPLPLTVNLDGNPQSILYTLSVGNERKNPGLPPMRNGAANAVNGAAKTFAVVRTPYSNEAPRLVELHPDELASGNCNINTQPQGDQPGRTASPIPTADQQPLRLDVPLGPGDIPVGLSLAMQQGVQGDVLIAQQSGNRFGYNFIAQQL